MIIMLNLAKRLAKVFKGMTRPKTTKAQGTIPQRNSVPTVPAVVIPTREESTARLIQILQAEVDRKLKAFLDAVEACPYDLVDAEELPETIHVRDAAAALGFDIVNFLEYEIAALCSAIEYHQQNGEEITVELVADVVEAINDNEYVFFMGVHDDEDLGCALTDEFQNTDAGWRVGWLIQAVDWERLGEDWRNETGGCYVSRGYFQFGSLEF